MSGQVRPFRRRRLPTVAGLLLLLAVIVSRWLGSASDSPAPPALAEGDYRVARVVDGDTLLLTNRARIRLQGIDTPETVHPDLPPQPWGAEATQFTQKFLAGETIRLEFDREREDQFGRLLAYVWVGDQMLNEELLRAGLARASLHFRYAQTMKRRFTAAQQEAKEARRGIWSRGDAHRKTTQHRSPPGR